MNKRLNFIDRYLTLWIFIAMAIGVGLGVLFPSIEQAMDVVTIGTTNIPLAVGLILMMYPPLVKVDFSKLSIIFSRPKLLLVSLAITWLVGPLLMFFLSVGWLNTRPDLMTGLILIGIAPCIAMVIVWVDLAGGNKELCAALIGVNSLLQVLFFSIYAYFLMNVVLPWIGYDALDISISIDQVAETVGLYLGLPFLLAIFTRRMIIRFKSELWLNHHFIPTISPITLWALLLTIVVMFSMKGQVIVDLPGDVLLVAAPLVVYFAIMFFGMFFIAKAFGADYGQTATLAFTASGNNFELAIAVAIGVFGINSGQAFAGVIGPLVEVPALILLVKASTYLKSKYFLHV
jgi:arsenite transporter